MYARIVQCGMFYRLKPHADSIHPLVAGIVAGIDVEVTRQSVQQASQLVTIRYIITGAMADVAVPEESTPRRTDRLWERTCCEAFFGLRDRDDYFEFNFSPSTEWAVYRFANYRQGMTPVDGVLPHIEVRRSDERLELVAVIDSSLLPRSQTSRIGLSAVIEERAGRKSYWALAHPSAKPDFHHPSSFVSLVD